jgi:hypothetical protein
MIDEGLPPGPKQRAAMFVARHEHETKEHRERQQGREVLDSQSEGQHQQRQDSSRDRAKTPTQRFVRAFAKQPDQNLEQGERGAEPEHDVLWRPLGEAEDLEGRPKEHGSQHRRSGSLQVAFGVLVGPEEEAEPAFEERECSQDAKKQQCQAQRRVSAELFRHHGDDQDDTAE